MSTPQEYWDACLIRTWRKHGTLQDVFSLFLSVTGQKATEVGVLRIPNKGIPWSMDVRIFVAEYLPKINDWLWDKPPEKDVVLLKKLSASKYNTLDKAFKTNMEKELQKEQTNIILNRKIRTLTTIRISERNQATDWGVTKGGRLRRAR